MDIYLFVLYLITIVGLLSIVGLFLIFFGIRPQTRRLIEESKKLQLKVNQIKSDFKEYGGTGEGLVKGAIGEIGIEGIMNELGIDPGLLKNPLVKGLVDKYAPRLIEQLSKKQGDNVQEVKGFM